MYFGSVKFFKRFILIFSILLLISSVLSSVYFGIQYKDAAEKLRESDGTNETLQRLVDYYNGEKSLSAADIAQIMEVCGISDEQLINALYEKNPSAFQKVIEKWESGKIPDTTIDSESAETNLTTPENDGKDVPVDQLYPELNFEYPTEPNYADDTNIVYLTFDGGPSEYTKKILEILDTHGIKATFFLVPEDTEKSFELMNRIVEAGHSIGISCAVEEYINVSDFLVAFEKQFELVYEATGEKCRLLRFQNNIASELSAEVKAEMKRRGFCYFGWNIDCGDSESATWNEMYNNVLSQTKAQERPVVLMRDGVYNTTLVLDDIINALLTDSRGLEFSALSEKAEPLVSD